MSKAEHEAPLAANVASLLERALELAAGNNSASPESLLASRRVKLNARNPRFPTLTISALARNEGAVTVEVALLVPGRGGQLQPVELTCPLSARQWQSALGRAPRGRPQQ